MRRGDRRPAPWIGCDAFGALKLFPIKSVAIYQLDDAKAAYLAVAASCRDRIVLRP